MIKSVVILGPAYPLRGGGMATFNERLARQYQSEGYHVIIYTFSLQYPSVLFPGSSQYSTEPPPHDLSIRVAVNSVNPFNWLKVGSELKQLRPDLLIVRYWLPFMGPCFGTILRRVKKNRHTKVVCIADNVIPHEHRPGDKQFTRYFLEPVDAFVTMSEKVMRDLQTFTNKPALQTVHPLYDNFGEALPKGEARRKLGLQAGDKIILFFGFIRAYKGLDLLLHAMHLLKSRGSHIRLIIAGEFYDNKKMYDDLIRDLNIADRLILHTGFIADSAVKYYLSAADFVIQPYRNATQSGVTPLAYHFEKPMLVTNVGGLPAMVAHNKAGVVAEPEATDIADKIEWMYERGDTYFLPYLRVEKEKYSWPAFTKAIGAVADAIVLK